MRALLLTLLVGLAALSGCLSDDDAPDTPDDTMDDTSTDDLTPQEPLHFTGSLNNVGDSVVGAVPPVCQEDVSCADHAFTVHHATSVTLTLKSINSPITDVTGQAASGTDYDLELFDAAGTSLGTSVQPSGTDDVITAVLAPGDYVAHVLAWNDQGGSYDLTITFA